jgi:hypothetical protein
MFSTMHQELWRNQLLKYDIVSFWGSQDDVSWVTRHPEALSSMLIYTMTRSFPKKAQNSACRTIEKILLCSMETIIRYADLETFK